MKYSLTNYNKRKERKLVFKDRFSLIQIVSNKYKMKNNCKKR